MNILKKKTGRMNSTIYMNSTVYMNSTIYVNNNFTTGSEQCQRLVYSKMASNSVMNSKTASEQCPKSHSINRVWGSFEKQQTCSQPYFLLCISSQTKFVSAFISFAYLSCI